MKIILAVLSPLLTLIIGNTQSTEERVERLFEQAYELLDSNPDSSYYYAETAFAIADRNNLEWHQAKARFIKGYICKQKGQFSKAIILYLESIDILENLDDQKSKEDHVKILVNCGNILKNHYKFEDAHQFYDRALKLAEQISFKEQILKVHFNKSMAYGMEERYDLSVEQALICHDLSVKFDDERMRIKTWNRLGSIHYGNKRFQEAEKYFSSIIDYHFNMTDGILHKARAYHNLANVYLEDNAFELAKSNYSNAIALYEQKNYVKGLFAGYRDMTSLFLKSDHLNDAVSTGEKAMQLYDKMPLELRNYQLYKSLSDLYHRLDNHDLSKLYIDKYHMENKEFIENRDFIAQQSDKFKLEVVLAGYKDQIKARKQVASLTNWLIVVLVIAMIILGLGYWRWKWIKSQLEIELRAHFKELAEIFAPAPTQDM